MHVHHVAFGVELHIPDLLEELRPAEHVLRPEHEVLEQLKLLGRKIEPLPIDCGFVLQTIDLDGPVAQQFGA